MKLSVRVKPSAKIEKVEKIDAASFTVSVKEPPKEGKANYVVIRVLADYFGIAPSKIHLVSGFSSRHKVFEVLL